MKLSTVQKIVTTITSFGAGTITTQIIRNNTVAVTPISKITMTAAMVVIAAMASESVGEWTNEKFDDLAEAVAEAKKKASTTES